MSGEAITQLRPFHFQGPSFWNCAGLDIRYLFHGGNPLEAATRRNIRMAVFFAIHGGKTLVEVDGDGQQAPPAA